MHTDGIQEEAGSTYLNVINFAFFIKVSYLPE